MSSADQGTWAWRAKLAWALLGPSILLLIQVEGVLAIADALGALRLRVDAARWTAAIALAALVLVTAAQLSTGLWRHAREARKDLLGRRLADEAKLLADLRADQRITPAPAVLIPVEPVPVEPVPVEPVPFSEPAPDALISAKGSPDWSPKIGDIFPGARIRRFSHWRASQFRSIIARFGLEPTWAYQTLDELGLPAARHLSRRAQLSDAQAAGNTSALAVALASVVGTVIVVTPAPGLADEVVVIAVVVVLALARWIAGLRSMVDFARQEEQYYPQLERLLELHRFELYKALAIEAPRDASEEKDGQLADWRQGRGDVQYVQPEAPVDGDVREQVQGLTDLLRGPELVGYEGYVSWELGANQVRLVFAKTPVAGATGSTSLQVAGSGSGSHAPFDITASSEDVVLTQVRRAVQAPVDGRTAQCSFDLAPRPDGGSRRAPVIWFEIRQRGRFIQLLRVSPRPDRSGRQAARSAKGSAPAGPRQDGW